MYIYREEERVTFNPEQYPATINKKKKENG